VGGNLRPEDQELEDFHHHRLENFLRAATTDEQQTKGDLLPSPIGVPPSQYFVQNVKSNQTVLLAHGNSFKSRESESIEPDFMESHSLSLNRHEGNRSIVGTK
jgi:hypothetical protein